MANPTKPQPKAAQKPTPKAAPAKPHNWRFFRSGGVDQVRIDRGSDIANLKHLDQKLWVALSCPVKGLEFDEKTLALIDSDNDGRVRALELLHAIDWTIERIVNPDELVEGRDALPIASISDATEEGKQLRACAKRILASHGRADATAITVADVANTEKVFATMKLNGDGVLPPSSIDDPELKKIAEEVLACVGGEKDRGGELGIDAAKFESFMKQIAAYSAWWDSGEARAKEILPLSTETPATYEALEAVRGKIDDFFARCGIAAYDERALAALQKRQEEHFAAAASDMVITADELKDLPLSRIEAGRSLPLESGINPAHVGLIAHFVAKVVTPLLGKGKKELSETEWRSIEAKLAPYGEWVKSKAGVAVEKLGLARIREIGRSNAAEPLAKLFAEDKTISGEMSRVASLDRLVRFYRDLHKLLVNFVSFADFYSKRDAIFQAGSLYLDGRNCDLCVKVESADKHSTMAVLAKTYLAYCDCTRPATGQKMTIAAAFTAGDSDHLMVGRNGVFYDKKGNDWDATIVKLLDQPISLGQAFWAPYKRLLRFIEEQVTKRASAADAAATERLQTGVAATAEAKPAAPAPPKPKMDIGVVAAIGVAAGSFLAAFSTLTDAFFKLGPYMPLGVLAVVLAISGPSMFIAWIKLRQRNLGPILDANGWAVNGRVKVNIPLGQVFTDTARLPPGSERSLIDPFAEQKAPWVKIVTMIVLVSLLTLGAIYHEKVVDIWREANDRFKKVNTQDEPKPADPGAPPAAGEKK